jgi:hypothetical protein
MLEPKCHFFTDSIQLRGIKKDMNRTAMAEKSTQCSEEDDVINNDDVGSSTASDKDSCNDKNEEEPPQKSRHRRKGIPQRAPFF